MFSVLLIGCGKIAGAMDAASGSSVQSHAAAIGQHPGFRIEACVDTNPLAARNFAEKFEIEDVYPSVDTIDEKKKFDLAVICSPDDTHFQVAHSLLTPGSPQVLAIFIEKPVCSTPEELKSLLELGNNRNIPIFVNMSRRFHHLYRHLKQTGFRAETGPLFRADIFYYGGWRHNGIHVVDTLSYIFDGGLVGLEVIDQAKDHKNDPTLSLRGRLSEEDAEIWIHGLTNIPYQVFDFDLKYSRGRLQIRNFESDVSWERAETNNRGESVLVPGSLLTGLPGITTFETAYSELHGFLQTGIPGNLSGVTLAAIAPVMNVLWSVTR